jgi:hypothetical protein
VPYAQRFFKVRATFLEGYLPVFRNIHNGGIFDKLDAES